MADNMSGVLMQLLGQQQSLGALAPAYDKAQGRYDKNYYDPYSQAAAGAPGMEADALGLGGADGTDRAIAAFKGAPDYQSGLDEGLTSLNRLAASRGMLASGNNTQDIIRFSNDYASKRFGDWLSRLGDFSGRGLSAAAGQTGRQNALAGLDTGYGNAQAGVYSNTANNITDLLKPKQQQQSGLGSAIAGGINLAGAAAPLFL